jgi:hypothetical protein
VRAPIDFIVGLANGIVLGSMLTLLFLRDRVNPTLQSNFDRWSSLLFYALIAVVVVGFMAKRFRKAH